MSVAPGREEVARCRSPVARACRLGVASSGMSTCFRRVSVAALGRALSLSRHASISAGSRLLVGEPGALDIVEVALVLVVCLRVLSAIRDMKSTTGSVRRQAST